MGCPFALFATKWFMCLYLSVFPIEVSIEFGVWLKEKTSLRVWDSFFVEGYKILFRIGLTVLKMEEKKLLNCNNTGDVINVLNEATKYKFDCRSLMKVIRKRLKI